MVDITANMNFLRKIGIQEWILDGDESFSGFFTYITTSISTDNILSDEELVEIAENGIASSTADAEELDTKMNEISQQYEGIWTLNDNDVTKLENELEIACQTEEMYEDLLAQLRAANTQIIEDQTTLNLKEKHLVLNEEKVALNCLKLADELQDARLKNEAKINDLARLYSKPQKSLLFMHQMPLNGYFQKLESFVNCAETYSQKNFKVQDIPEIDEIFSEDNSNLAPILNELEKMADRLFNALQELFQEKMTVHAQTKLVEHFKLQNWTPSSLAAMRREMAEMENRSTQIHETTKDRLLIKLQEQSYAMAKLDVEAVVCESNKKRMGRAKQRIEHLKQFVDIVSNTLMNCECVWILMQLDLQRMKKRNDHDGRLDKYRMESLTCNRRMDVMHSIQKSSTNELLQHYCKQQMKLLAEHLDEKSIAIGGEFSENRIINLVAGIDKVRQNVAELLKIFFDEKSMPDDKGFFQKSQSLKNDLLQYINDGPVNKHQYWSVWHQQNRIWLQKEMQALTERIELGKEEFRQYQAKNNEDKFWRQKQVLWIWFLTEPKKVLKAIKAISSEAQLNSRPVMGATGRPVAGIVRKM